MVQNKSTIPPRVTPVDPSWAIHRSPRVHMRQQTCLLYDTADVSADMSAVSHRRHVCCVTQQTCLLCHSADMSAVSHSRHVCCVTQQTCLLCHTADMSAVSHSSHVCCVRKQTCLKRDKCKHGPPLHAQCKYNTTMNAGNSRQAPKAGRPARPKQKAIRRTTSSCGVRETGGPLNVSLYAYKRESAIYIDI